MSDFIDMEGERCSVEDLHKLVKNPAPEEPKEETENPVCVCDDETLTMDFTCDKCQKGPNTVLMSKFDRMMICKIHKFIPICGSCSLICNECKDAGWYSTKGCGSGYWHFINKKTGEKIPGYKERESSDGEIF